MGTWPPLPKYHEAGHRSPHHQSRTWVTAHCLGALMCWTREHSWPVWGRGSALRWHHCCLLPGRAHGASLAWSSLRRLAGRASPRDAAFHLQRLGPAFILIGVPAVLHMLQGQGSGESQPQPSGTPERTGSAPGPVSANRALSGHPPPLSVLAL